MFKLSLNQQTSQTTLFPYLYFNLSKHHVENFWRFSITADHFPLPLYSLMHFRMKKIARIIENQFSLPKISKKGKWYFTVDFTFGSCILWQIPAERIKERKSLSSNRKFCLLFHQLHISDFECLYLCSAFIVQWPRR